MATATAFQKPRTGEALLWASVTSALFFLLYSSLNAFTATLNDVPSLYMNWETGIPFVPWMILPYMSIDLLFFFAFFACRARGELQNLGQRVLFAIGISTLLFFIYPMKFAFDKPATDGVFGFLFQILMADLPYNQFPSLHVSLAIIVATFYRQHATGWKKRLSDSWFMLIVLSTVFVYQHHVIDVVGGAIVGLLALHAFPAIAEHPVRVTCRHRRMATRYGMTAVALGLLASVPGGWFMLFLYPAASLGLVAAAYLAGNTNFLQKRNGRIPLSAQLLFGPYLLGVCWTWKYHRCRDKPHVAITEKIILGRRLDAIEARKLIDNGVIAVLDLAPEVKNPCAELPVSYRYLPVLDFTSPSGEQIGDALEFIRRHKKQGKIYVHCTLGYLRSATIVAALLAERGLCRTEIAALLKRKRPRIKLRHCLPESGQCGDNKDFVYTQG